MDEATILRTLDEKRDRLAELQTEMDEIDAAHVGATLDNDAQDRWDAIKAEIRQIKSDIRAQEQRMEDIKEFGRSAQVDPDTPHVRMSGLAGDGGLRIGGVGRGERVSSTDIWDLSTVRTSALNPTGMAEELRSRALVAVERSSFPFTGTKDEDAVRTHIARLLDFNDTPNGDLARHLIATGSPTYRRAWGKAIQGQFLTSEEQRALATGSSSTGGAAVPFQLDPTVIDSSDGVVNPIRQIARVEQTISNEWRGITSDGVTAHYRQEGAEVGDDSPSLAQPVITPERVDVFVPFSMEIQQDWRGMEAEVARMINEAKDTLEAEKFLTGAGSGADEPEGILTGLTTLQRIRTESASAFAVEDVYATRAGVPPRFRNRASFIANLDILDLVRQFDTGGGADLWVRLPDDTPDQLIGKNTYEASEMSGDVVAGEKILLCGDFRQYAIADRIGMNVELVPHLFGTGNNRPTGQRGFLAVWRNSAGVLVKNAFRYLEVAST